MLASSYNPFLVICSVLVAILASYTALHMAGRIASVQGRAAHWWLLGGACAMGLGIWSMHFVGMLAFSLPITIGYDPLITGVSLLIAVAVSAFALWVVAQKELPVSRLVFGSMLMGPAIAGMHYAGMAAMRMSPGIDYDMRLGTLSVAIAIVASGAALWIAFHLRKPSSGVFLLRGIASLVMGVAIVGMHYTGMAAARFPMGSICLAADEGVNTGWLAFVVIVVTLAVMAIALIISVLDFRMEARTAVLATSLAEANEELAHQARHDSLTQLPNRMLLEDRFAQLVRTTPRFFLMFMDLDGFKAVNDAFGHHVGDQLLVEVSRRIRAIVRAHDTVARVGGDEFVLLLAIGNSEEAAHIAALLTKSIERPVRVGDRDIQVSASIGIATYPEHGRTQSELLSNADTATYRAKSSGRNGFCFFDPSMHADTYQQMQLVQELHVGLTRGELMLHYQPKFDAITGAPVGAEALLRWIHPVHGLLPPNRFIPIAEKSGLIVAIGEWVLNEACRQAHAWLDAGLGDWSIAVNLSAAQFAHSGLAQTVRDTLARHRLDAHHLILEITESTAMNDVEASLSVMQQLREAGVQIAIDDFGTGYSSLLYLKRFPANELKIDRGFVRDLARNTEDAAIVSAIIALGRTLNLRIVAEGVETPDQQTFLTKLGCDVLQGFLLGRPMPAEAFVKAVAATRFRSYDAKRPDSPVRWAARR
jgi:diguanylate cyclase